MPNRYDQGNVIRVLSTFTTSGDTNQDPSSSYFAVSIPGGAVNSIDVNSVVNPSTGLFYFDFPVNTPGEYFYRAIGLGTGQAQSFGAFQVNSAMF